MHGFWWSWPLFSSCFAVSHQVPDRLPLLPTHIQIPHQDVAPQHLWGKRLFQLTLCTVACGLSVVLDFLISFSVKPCVSTWQTQPFCMLASATEQIWKATHYELLIWLNINSCTVSNVKVSQAHYLDSNIWGRTVSFITRHRQVWFTCSLWPTKTH